MLFSFVFSFFKPFCKGFCFTSFAFFLLGLPSAYLTFTKTTLNAFPPRSEAIFLGNLERLLTNGQYQVLGEYFIKYYQKPYQTPAENTESRHAFLKAASPASEALLARIVKEVPLASVKTNIINHAIKARQLAQQRHVLHCYKGEHLAFAGEYQASNAAYHLCPSKKRFFFLAGNYKALGHAINAIRMYRYIYKTFPEKKTKPNKQKYLEQQKMQQLSIIALSKLYLQQNNIQQSLFFAEKIPSGIQQEMAFYHAYVAADKEELAKKRRENIARKYNETLLGKAFLQKNAVKDDK